MLLQPFTTHAQGHFNGKAFTIPEGHTILKLHTPTHYVFLDIDEKGSLVDLVGRTSEGEKYETKPAFGVGGAFNRVKGKTQSFGCRVEGNNWYHKGTLTGGLTIDEVWSGSIRSRL
jgi:hypothetical protein